MSIKAIDESGALVPAPRNLPTELFVDFDRRDDNAIIAELQGAVVEEYVYSFKQGQQTVMGLSLPGVMAVAQNMGGITCGQPIWTVTDDDITCDISATDHKVGLTVWGTATANKVENNRPDKFARAKALSKAQRNAIRKVIPETVATEMLRMFIGGKSPQRQRPPARAQQPEPRELAPPPVEIIDAAPRLDPETMKRQFLTDLPNVPDRRDLSAYKARIQDAGLWDDADVYESFSAAYERLGGKRRSQSETPDGQQPLV